MSNDSRFGPKLQAVIDQLAWNMAVRFARDRAARVADCGDYQLRVVPDRWVSE